MLPVMTQEEIRSREHITTQRTPDSGSGLWEMIRGFTSEANRQVQQVTDTMNGADALLRMGAEVTGSVAAQVSIMPEATKDWWRIVSTGMRAPLAVTRALWQISTTPDHQLALSNLDASCRAIIAVGKRSVGDKETNAKLNYRFFTHNPADKEGGADGHGSLNAVNEEEIRSYFKPGNEANWPNLLLTSSHALCRDHDDVSGIMQGFHGLIANSFAEGSGSNRKPADIPLERIVRGPEHQPKDGQRPLMLISSVFNDHNAPVNGGKLGLRMLYLDRLREKIDSEHLSHPSAEEVVGSKHYAMSPASVREGRLLLSLLAENPAQVPVPGREDFEKGGGYKHPAKLLLKGDEPVVLRADAHHILQHIKLAGYSKGGGIQTDTMRLMLAEMQAEMEGGVRRFHLKEKDGTIRPLNDQDIREMMQNVGILCVNPGISPLSSWETGLGMRRMTVRNQDDTITAYLFDRDGFRKPEAHDDIYVVKPIEVSDPSGHGFVDCMGHYDRGITGYLNDESNIRFSSREDRLQFDEFNSRLQCFMASFVGKVGIARARDVEGGFEIEFSTGGDGQKKEAVGHQIEEAMKQENLPLKDMHRVERTNRLQFRFDDEFMNGRKSVTRKKFIRALEKVEQADPDLLVSRKAYRELAGQSSFRSVGA
jgi:hypothetical protein